MPPNPERPATPQPSPPPRIRPPLGPILARYTAEEIATAIADLSFPNMILLIKALWPKLNALTQGMILSTLNGIAAEAAKATAKPTAKPRR